MAMTLFIIRHGATEGSELKQYKGRIDVPLSALGQTQIKSSADFIAQWLSNASIARKSSYLNELYHFDGGFSTNIDFIYCSTLSRAVQSAEILAKRFSPKPSITAIDSLRERDFGLWEGLSFSEIKEKYPDAFSKWAKDPFNYAPPRGESTTEVLKRTTGALEAILQRHILTNANVAVVAHGGVNRVLLCYILGMPLENIFRIEQDNACVNIIEYWDMDPVVKLLNGCV